MFNPFGEIPVLNTLAPNEVNKFGPDLYPAPLAQSNAIFIPSRLNEDGKFYFRIFIYLSLAFSNLLTRPNLIGLERFFEIFKSINFSIFFSILSDNFNPSGPNILIHYHNTGYGMQLSLCPYLLSSLLLTSLNH